MCSRVIRAIALLNSTQHMNEGACIIAQAIKDPVSWVHVKFHDFHISQGLRTSPTQHEALKVE